MIGCTVENTTVNATGSGGGIAGEANGTIQFVNCSVASTFVSSNSSGGIVGQITNGDGVNLTNCFNLGFGNSSMIVEGCRVGGIGGYFFNFLFIF